MHGGEDVAVDRRRADALEPEPAALIELALDRRDPCGLLRVTARVVLERAGVLEEHARHRGYRTRHWSRSRPRLPSSEPAPPGSSPRCAPPARAPRLRWTPLHQSSPL